MTRRDTVLLITLAVLAAVYVPAKKHIGERRNAARYLIAEAPARITGFSVYNGNRKTVLQKEEGRYVFEAPWRGVVAEPTEVERFLRDLVRLEAVRRLDVAGGDRVEDFGITARSPKITVDRGGRSSSFVLGRRSPVGAHYYVFREETGDLFLTGERAQRLFTAVPEEFRDRRLFGFSPDKAAALEFRRGRGALSFRRQGEDWYVTDEKGAEFLCEPAQLIRLLGMLAELPLSDFGPADRRMTLPAAGLVPPRLSVTVETSTGAVRAAFGAGYGGNRVYASVGGALAGGVEAAALAALERPAETFRRESLLNVPPALVVSFTEKTGETFRRYEKKRGKWYRTSPRRQRADDEKIVAFIKTLAAARIEKYLPDDPQAPVKREYVFRNRTGKELLSLLVGETSGGYVQVRFQGKRGAFGIPESYADYLMP